MPNPVLPRASEIEVLTDLIASGNLLNGVKVHLFTDNIVLSESIQLTDLHEPTFTGYAKSSAVSWGTPLNQPGGGAYVEAPAKEFRCTADSTGEIVRGYYLSKDAVVGPPAIDEQLVAVALFDEPVPISALNDGVWVTPKFGYPDLAV